MNEQEILNYIEKKVALGETKKINKVLEDKKTIWGYNLTLYKLKKGRVVAQGTMNRTESGHYVLYVDYDLMEKQWVEDELRHMQANYILGSIHLFRSSKNHYHAICFDKLTAKEFIEILENSSCDIAFQKTPRFVTLRNWVLRCFAKGNTPKPKYLKTLKSDFGFRKESSAHWKAISSIHPQLKKYPLENGDSSKKLYLIKYLTANNIGKA